MYFLGCNLRTRIKDRNIKSKVYADYDGGKSSPKLKPILIERFSYVGLYVLCPGIITTPSLLTPTMVCSTFIR